MRCVSLAAQQQPTFRACTDLVQLDVVVVDAEGRPVRGLTKDDFLISDRTWPQAVAVFEEIAHERPPAPILPPTLRQDVADNTTGAADRIVMLVLDDLHFQGKTDDVKIMALRVVEQIGTPASVGLVTTSGVFVWSRLPIGRCSSVSLIASWTSSTRKANAWTPLREAGSSCRTWARASQARVPNRKTLHASSAT